jgi:rRNA-processing protein FCF1
VLLDTNALFLPVRTGFPLEAEIDRLVPGARVLVASSTLRELDRLVTRATPDAGAARTLADRFGSTPAVREGDAAVLEVARRESALVVTADRELQTRLRAGGITVLAPRDRHRLEMRLGRPRSTRRRARPRGNR